MTGEEKEVPAEFEGVDTEEFTKDELEELLKGDGDPAAEAKADEPAKTEPEPEKEAEPAKEHPKGYVPTQALREAREKLKTKDEELNELRGVQNRLIEKVVEHRAQPEPDPVKAIDINEDPMGWMANVGDKVDAIQAESQQNAEEQQKAQAQYSQEERTIGGFVGYRDELTRDDPDTVKALDYAIVKQGEAFRENGLHGQALNNAMRGEIIRQANIVGSLPEEQRKQHILGTARYFGYEAELAKEPAKNLAKEQIDKLEAIQSATKTLSGGGTANAEMTLEDVENMTGAELDQIALKDPEFFARLGLED